MARIRSAKPEWWRKAKWCAIPRDVRSTYKGIWEVMADDEGRFQADTRLIKGDVWPLDDDITTKKLEKWLQLLATVPVSANGKQMPSVLLYEVAGVRYGFLPGFVKHQKISHATPSKLPAPPEPLPNNSGKAPEPLRPDVDLDVDVDVIRKRSGGVELPASLNSQLPEEARSFLSAIYEFPAMNAAQVRRYKSVAQQLVDTLDPKYPGPKVRGGQRVKARSIEHLSDVCREVRLNPPNDRDMSIVFVLKKLLDPPKGPSVTEVHKREEAGERQMEERYHAAARQAGITWAKEHPERYQEILTSVEANYRGKSGPIIKMARDAELVQRCAKAAAFPPFEQWNTTREMATA